MFGRKIFWLLILMFATLRLNANEPLIDPLVDEILNEEEFAVERMIFKHILDNHEWHIMTVGKTHVTVPLPILLIHNGKFHAFMSSKFHHGHSDYRGFRWVKNGEYKNKIVHINSSGEISPKLPIDLSITKNVFSILFTALLLFFIFINVAKAYKKRGAHQAPVGLQSILEPVILFVRDDIAKSTMPVKYIDRYLPYLLTLFFFILFCNLLGLMPFFPGGANVTGNIAVTMVLAVLTFLITTFSGKRAYFRELINFPGAPWWMKFPLPLMPAIEIMGVFTKPLVLMIRLFANMMAGHVVILGFVGLIFVFGKLNVGLGYGTSIFSVAFAIFVMALELIVAFVQAFVFTLLTSLYIGSALQEHHETVRGNLPSKLQDTPCTSHPATQHQITQLNNNTTKQ
ncbi:MAG: F0F1 ATP synthase subunit A [Bacteroidales bacterium]|nr:F0F1 ATP synthase subunit A [Bacteroidales bacterium]